MTDDSTPLIQRFKCLTGHEWSDWEPASEEMPNPYHRRCERCGKREQAILYD